MLTNKLSQYTFGAEAHDIQMDPSLILHLPPGPTKESAKLAYVESLQVVYILGTPTAGIILLAVYFLIRYVELEFL